MATEWQALAEELIDLGLTYGQVGMILGLSKTIAFRIVNPGKAREHKRRYREKLRKARH